VLEVGVELDDDVAACRPQTRGARHLLAEVAAETDDPEPRPARLEREEHIEGLVPAPVVDDDHLEGAACRLQHRLEPLDQ